MSIARRLSSIRLRNPFRRHSKATKAQSNRGNATIAVIEDREEPRVFNCPGNEDESHYRPLRNGPKRKSACFCCEQRFTAVEKFLPLGKRKCKTCHRRICKNCAHARDCHVCEVKRSLDLDPQSLMQVEAKELVAVLHTLHFADVNFINWPKQYLIKQLYTRLEIREDWDPAELRTYRITTDDNPEISHVKFTETRDLIEEENKTEEKSKQESSDEKQTGKQQATEEKPSTKCAEDPEEGPSSSTMEQVRQKQLQDPASKDVDDIPHEDLCKICMDFPVNCILLNCGHLVVCIYCSDFLQECPICREAIVRVIQTKIT